MGPNRRTDKTVIEVNVSFSPKDERSFPRTSSEIRDLLVAGGILGVDDGFPQKEAPNDRENWYTSLLLQTALLFQNKAGHKVSYFSVSPTPEKNSYMGLVEHEDCDVGMTAVKLACELFTGERKLLAKPFQMFSEFAGGRSLPPITEAIIEAARQRDIPCIPLERHPFKREDFEGLTGGRCVMRNGLLMLGQGVHQQVLDGTYSINRSEDFMDVLRKRNRQVPAPNDLVHRLEQCAPVAEDLLDWLYPADEQVRIPIIAVTGTNGKTTTTRLITHIMRSVKFKTGMACTDGVFVDEKQIDTGDQSARSGHLKVLTNSKTDVAILETHHAGIVTLGFAFRWCDIAVCLNVTEEHLEEGQVKTVEQMASVKRALLERARHAAVINADDRLCLEMIPAVTARKVCLVSMQSSVEELAAKAGQRMACCCVLEQLDGVEWIVIHNGDLRLPVIPVVAIPATFDGTARFNVANAMHAAAACYLAGIAVESVSKALGTFSCSYESTPGRLNVFDDLPFKIIMDFAHNPDGLSKLCEFIDQQPATGRKLVAFAGTITRSDETLKKMGSAVAGHFDFYFCKEHVRADGKYPRKVAGILKQGLLASGVDEKDIAVVNHGREVIFRIFDACHEGDLLVLALGHVEKHLLRDHISAYAGKLARSGERNN